MEIGSKEWNAETTDRLNAEAEPELAEMIEDAWGKHGIDKLMHTPEDARRLVVFASEVQSGAVGLGMRLATKVLAELVDSDLAQQREKAREYPECETSTD